LAHIVLNQHRAKLTYGIHTARRGTKSHACIATFKISACSKPASSNAFQHIQQTLKQRPMPRVTLRLKCLGTVKDSTGPPIYCVNR
jgi:hypothetical protein